MRVVFKKFFKFFFLPISILFGIFFAFNIRAATLRIVPNDPAFGQQWYLLETKAPEAWFWNTGASQVIVAVLDTGVQIDHPDLEKNIWTNKNEIPDNKIDDDKNGYIDDVHGWDFVRNVSDPSPKFDERWTEAGIVHGTVISSIISARAHNEQGIAGVAWVGTIMPLRVLDSTGIGTTTTVVEAIQYAVANGANIINLSFSGPDFDAQLFDAVKAAYEKGVVVVAAAGNAGGGLLEPGGEGINLNDRPMYPVCFGNKENNEKLVIGVSAIDQKKERPSFSNYGSECIDIAAPGTDFFTAYVKKENIAPFDGYYAGYFDGTSMAAPLISGALVLVKSLVPSLGPEDLYDILVDGADSLSGSSREKKGDLGVGGLNIEKMVLLAVEKRKTIEKNLFEEKKILISSDTDSQDSFILVSPKNNLSPELRIFDNKGNLLRSFFAYPKSFQHGFSLSVGDVDGDGIKDIITAPNQGGGPQIRMFRTDGSLMGQFFAFPENFRGGVDVAVR